jgi:hypothetical protein
MTGGARSLRLFARAGNTAPRLPAHRPGWLDADAELVAVIRRARRRTYDYGKAG